MGKKKQPTNSYERFGLITNPFQQLDSESIDDVQLFHVNQPFDAALATLREEVYERQSKAAVLIVGPLGAGKTERLLLAKEEAERREATCVLHQLTEDVRWITRGLSEDLRKAARLGSVGRFFSTPKWYQKLAKLPSKVKRRYDPESVGRVIAEGLNANAPAFLLLNDLHNIASAEEADRFLQTLQAIVTHAAPGIMVMMTATPDYMGVLEGRHPALTTRFNRVIRLEPLSQDEAGLMLAKRLTGHRIVEDLDPLYPFTPEVVAEIRKRAGASPRELLKAADRVLEEGAKARAYRIDADMARAALGSLPEAPAEAEAGPDEPPEVPTPDGHRPAPPEPPATRLAPVVVADAPPSGFAGRLLRTKTIPKAPEPRVEPAKEAPDGNGGVEDVSSLYEEQQPEGRQPMVRLRPGP